MIGGSLIGFLRGIFYRMFTGFWTWGLTSTTYTMQYDWILVIHGFCCVLFCTGLIFSIITISQNYRTLHAQVSNMVIVFGIAGFFGGAANMIVKNGAPVDIVNTLIFYFGVPVMSGVLILGWWSAKEQYFQFHIDCMYFPLTIAFGASMHRTAALMFYEFFLPADCFEILIQNSLYTCFMGLAILASLTFCYLHYFFVLRHNKSALCFMIWIIFTLYINVGFLCNLYRYYELIAHPQTACYTIAHFGNDIYYWKDIHLTVATS